MKISILKLLKKLGAITLSEVEIDKYSSPKKTPPPTPTIKDKVQEKIPDKNCSEHEKPQR